MACRGATVAVVAHYIIGPMHKTLATYVICGKAATGTEGPPKAWHSGGFRVTILRSMGIPRLGTSGSVVPQMPPLPARPPPLCPMDTRPRPLVFPFSLPSLVAPTPLEPIWVPPPATRFLDAFADAPMRDLPHQARVNWERRVAVLDTMDSMRNNCTDLPPLLFSGSPLGGCTCPTLELETAAPSCATGIGLVR